MSTKTTKLPAWFNGELYKEGGTAYNRFSGEGYELNNVELSMYDFVIGASTVIEMGLFNTSEHLEDLRKGLNWFRKYNAKAYMVLLD